AKEMINSDLDAIRKTIREKEPVRPSTRLTQKLLNSDPALHSKSKIKNLKSQIHSDLDWIVMKCLEKDRTRRYETASGLAADIQHHLSNEPVSARPPNATYRFQKWIRRNKLTFGAVASVAVMLILGVVVSTWQAIRATRAQREQNRQRETAEKARASE